MPALHLDAAIVHTNRADTAGNGQVLSPDPFFDPLFLGAAERRFMTTERIVENGALADEAHPLSTVPIHRMLTDGVAETRGGAHFTANPPDYGRDEAFQKEYAAAAADPAEWEAFANRYVLVDEDEYQARVEERQAAVSDDGVTRAEFCVVACADAWRGAGEVMASPFGTIPSLGARLAKLTFAPDLVLTDGEAALMVGAPPIATRPDELVREAAMPYRSVFDVVWSGRRHIMMMASQIDRTGNQNISAIGPHDRPKVQLVGVRGAPGNSVNHPTSYWVPDHSVRTFVEQVDVVSGVGYARAAAAGPAATRFHDVRRVVSNLGVFDFETPERTMRLRSYHPGVTRRRHRGRHRVRRSSSRRTWPRRAAPRPRSSTSSASCSTRARCATARCGADRRTPGPPLHPGAAHRAVRPGRRALPPRADRHGLGGRPPPRRRHLRGRRSRHPGLGHHDARRARRRHRRGARAGRGPPSASTCAPTWPTCTSASS